MPEGPSIIILREKVRAFKGKIILSASGNSTQIDFSQLQNQKVTAFKSWGKHFLICFKNFTVRVHFLLFGSYRVNERREEMTPRLQLVFENGEINFYSCSVRMLEGKPDAIYDWSADVMSKKWDPAKARKKIRDHAGTMVCDLLLDQDIFAGVGNIIKNEVLYRIKIHPESLTGKLPARKVSILVKEAVQYSNDFLKWKKEFTLRKHWLAHTKKTCLRCNLPIIKKYTGKKNRRSFFCSNCQTLYE